MEIDASGCQLDDCVFHSGLNFLNLNDKRYKNVECETHITVIFFPISITSKLEIEAALEDRGSSIV